MLYNLILLLVASFASFTSAVPVDSASIDSHALDANVTAQMSGVDAAARARKRGVSYNGSQHPRMFKVPGNDIAWIYNWWQLPESPGQARVDTPFWEYVPILHSDHPDHTNIWFGNIDKCARVDPGGAIHVLSFNEPDQCGNGGSCMRDFVNTANMHKKWVQPLVDKYGSRMWVGTPAVTNGVRAPDGGPMGLPWLKEFLRHCDGCKFDYVVIHWYDAAQNVEYFKRHLREAWDTFQKPLWITEFGATGSEQEQIHFLEQVLPWMDSQPWVFRYAMFMAEPGKLVAADGRGLSRLGQSYATI